VLNELRRAAIVAVTIFVVFTAALLRARQELPAIPIAVEQKSPRNCSDPCAVSLSCVRPSWRPESSTQQQGDPS
jgi:hypothetical protein